MPNAQYFSSRPMTQDWTSEIGGGPAVPAMASASSSTTTTTTTSSSSSAAGHAAQAPATVTNTTTQTPAYSAPPPAIYPQESQTLPPAAGSEEGRSVGTLDLETHQPIEVVEAPTSMNEAFLGSLKSMLLRNRGNLVTATFLIGTQGTTAWEGVLHDVGNDYLIIYQPGRERYIACDIYALKYIEFYDTRRREMCETLLRQNGMRNTF